VADNASAQVARFYRATHALILKVAEPLDEGQLTWQPGETAPTIAFHLWHLARWADYLQEMIAEDGSQVWEREGLAARWGLDPETLGFAQTGMAMADADAAAFILPSRKALIDYLRQALAAADLAVSRLSDDDWQRRVRDRHSASWQELSIGELVVGWLAHDSRHLGMIEALLGVRGQHGTATR